MWLLYGGGEQPSPHQQAPKAPGIKMAWRRLSGESSVGDLPSPLLASRILEPAASQQKQKGPHRVQASAETDSGLTLLYAVCHLPHPCPAPVCFTQPQCLRSPQRSGRSHPLPQLCPGCGGQEVAAPSLHNQP